MKNTIKLFFTVFIICIIFTSLCSVGANDEIQSSERKAYEFDVLFLRDWNINAFFNEESEYVTNLHDITFHRSIILSEDGTKIVQSNAYYYEYFTADTIKILGDEDALLAFLGEKGLTNVEEYIIGYNSDITDGYFLCVKCESGIYVIPFIADYETKSPLEDRKVYKSDEFLKLLTVEGTLIINGEVIDCDVNPVFDCGLAFYPLRATLEALGIEVIWDSEERSATFGNMKIYIDNPEKDILSIETDELVWGSFRVVNDRILVQSWFLGELENNLGYEANYNIKDFTVEISNEPKKPWVDPEISSEIRLHKDATLGKICNELTSKGWIHLNHDYSDLFGMQAKYTVIPEMKNEKNSLFYIIEATGGGEYDDAKYIFVIVLFSEDNPKGEITGVYYSAGDGREWKPSADANPLTIVDSSSVKF